MTPPQRRIVTGHENGKSKVLIDDLLEPNPGFAAKAATLWQNHKYPAELSSTDASQGQSLIYNKGSLIRVVDFPPSSQGHNHRTKSLDYGIVIEGEIELLLEDGSKTIVKAGDVVVQQAVGTPLDT